MAQHEIIASCGICDFTCAGRGPPAARGGLQLGQSERLPVKPACRHRHTLVTLRISRFTVGSGAAAPTRPGHAEVPGQQPVAAAEVAAQRRDDRLDVELGGERRRRRATGRVGATAGIRGRRLPPLRQGDKEPGQSRG